MAAEAAQQGVAAAAEVAQPDAAAGEAVVLQDAAAEEAGAELAAGVPQGAPDALEELLSGLPWVAAWVFRRDRPLPAAPLRTTPTVRAMECSPVAWPSARSWQATLFVVLSCALGPGRILKGGRDEKPG